MGARAGFIAVLGLLVAVVACGDNGTASKTTPTSTVSTTPTTMSTEWLEAMLLDVSDVGTGWQVGADVNAADFSDSTQVPCNDVPMDPAVTKRLTPLAGIQFEPTDHSYKHLIEFLVPGDPNQLESDLQAFFGAMESCSTGTPTPTGTGMVTVEKLIIPSLGDQRAAYAITGAESADATWYVRSAAVRIGSVAAEVGLTEVLSTPQGKPTMSDTEFVDLVQTAAAKLSG